MRHLVIAAVLATLSCATTTQFTGSAKVPNGAAGCQARCASYGMELTGMVALGNYSDGCICELSGRRSQGPGAGASGAVAAVMEAIRLDRQQEARALQPEPPAIYLPPRTLTDVDARCIAAGGEAAR
ncbi:MAG TPA: hypothetical protein VG496_12325 [Myxococcales bacterium]|nr:hypothetical protein [Myxococcales bacterium]